jgi:DNA-binding GntR family transcriptional regulator
MPTQTELVYETVKQRILSGEYKPAQSLTEAMLVSDLNVSRNTIKKALLKLASEQLVLIETNKTAIVRSFSLDEMMQKIEVREVLEGLIMEQAFPFITKDILAEMGNIISSMQSYIQANDFVNYSETNLKFHEIIYNVCPNKFAVEVVQSIKTQFRLYNLRIILLPGRSQTTFEDHKNIYRAICEGNPEVAVLYIRKHFANIKQVITTHFSFLK